MTNHAVTAAGDAYEARIRDLVIATETEKLLAEDASAARSRAERLSAAALREPEGTVAHRRASAAWQIVLTRESSARAAKSTAEGVSRAVRTAETALRAAHRAG